MADALSFDSIQDVAAPQAQPQAQTAPSFDSIQGVENETAPSFDSIEDVSGKFDTPGQKALTAVEGATKGFAGPVATYAEKKLSQHGVPGLTPQEQQARAAINPWTHGLSEAAGFGAGALTGTGEAAALAKVGEAAKSIAGMSKASTVGARLAAAAVGQAAEMGAFQAGDEVSKYINNAPQSVGSAVVDVGLSSLLGGIAGPAFEGTGMGIEKVVGATGLKDFVDRLAYRKANIDPNEMIKNEADNVINTYNTMNNEIGGSEGLKARAISNLLPKQITPKISEQIQGIINNGNEAIEKLASSKVPERYIEKLRSDLNAFTQASSEGASPGQQFDAMNAFKKTLQDYSKGNYGPFAVPSYHEAYDFLNATKKLGFEVRQSLENPKVWGEAADLQKNLNKSWVKALPAAKDFEKKFMVRVGDELVISPDKFNTYMNQAGRATSTTDRQKMLGNFISAMENHFNTVDSLYKHAGAENPFSSVGMSTLKDSLNKKSTGTKLADIWHDKLQSSAIGSTLGAVVGGKAGALFGQGLGGVYLGKEVLGPVFSSMIKPLLERYPSIDVRAFNQALEYTKSVMRGDKAMTNAIGSLFVGAGKTFPSSLLPDAKDLKKLDDRSKALNSNLEAMSNIPGSLDYYRQGHSAQVSKTVGDTVTYINNSRPQQTKKFPLDSTPPVSNMQKAAFDRTLEIAQQPLVVVKHMQDGTLTSSDVVALKTMHPAVYETLSQKLMEQMVEHEHNEESIPYRTKMMMSLFLGQPLDSSMSPASIQAAQPAPRQPASMPQTKGKPKSTKTLGKDTKTYQTPDQASENRRVTHE